MVELGFGHVRTVTRLRMFVAGLAARHGRVWLVPNIYRCIVCHSHAEPEKIVNIHLTVMGLILFSQARVGVAARLPFLGFDSTSSVGGLCRVTLAAGRYPTLPDIILCQSQFQVWVAARERRPVHSRAAFLACHIPTEASLLLFYSVHICPPLLQIIESTHHVPPSASPLTHHRLLFSHFNSGSPGHV